MSEKRLGRQTPVKNRILPYTASLGAEATELYERSKRNALEWQQRLIEDIMAVNDEGLWVHMKFGYSIPRRNGKSEVVIMRCIWGLTRGERVFYTAHRTATSRSVWLKIIDILTKAGFVEVDGKKIARSSFGLSEGSTIVTLSRDYINTLSAGAYDIEIVTNQGTARGSFRVSTSPKTGDNNDVTLWVTEEIVSLLGMTAITWYLFRRKET